MPVVKLFNGEEFSCEIIEDRESELIVKGFSYPKRIVQKKDIFSIDF